MCYRYNIVCWCARLEPAYGASACRLPYFRCNKDLKVNIIGYNLPRAFGMVTVWTLYFIIKSNKSSERLK
jgi:hypothetical protein